VRSSSSATAQQSWPEWCSLSSEGQHILVRRATSKDALFSHLGRPRCYTCATSKLDYLALIGQLVTRITLAAIHRPEGHPEIPGSSSSSWPSGQRLSGRPLVTTACHRLRTRKGVAWEGPVDSQAVKESAGRGRRRRSASFREGRANRYSYSNDLETRRYGRFDRVEIRRAPAVHRQRAPSSTIGHQEDNQRTPQGP
jgi:hypothetical protein